MTVVGNGNTDVGKETARSSQTQMAAAMPQQGAYVMGDNECSQQKLVRLVGYRDPKAALNRARLNARSDRARQFGETKP